MNKPLNAAWLATALILATAAAASAADRSRVYVEFQPGQKNTARALVQQAGGQIHHEFDSLNAVATTLPIAALAGIRNNPNVVLVEDDPPRYLLGCDIPAEQIPYGIDAVQATAVWDANNDGFVDNRGTLWRSEGRQEAFVLSGCQTETPGALQRNSRCPWPAVCGPWSLVGNCAITSGGI